MNLGIVFSWEQLASSFLTTLQPQYLLLMLFAVSVGILFGAIPGISANMAVTLFLPITFGMDPLTAMAVLLAVYIGGISGGLISAILLRIPGTPASIATSFDGYPLAQKGEAAKALGTAIMTSFVGGMCSFIVLIFLTPTLANYALKFQPWEFFSVSVFSLTLIGSLVGKSVIRGLISAIIGMSIAMVGVAPHNHHVRMTFGWHSLDAGFGLIGVMIGMFAVPELINLLDENMKGTSVDAVPYRKVKGFGISIREYCSHYVNIVRSAVIGICIGILPGIGGDVSSMMAYISAKDSSKHPETFGQGDLDGIIAPETANNATIGGALVTMLALGLPGSTTVAILMSALTVHGILPGPTLFLNRPDIIYFIFTCCIVANILMLIVEFWGLRIFVRLLSIPKKMLLPLVVMMCFVGAYAAGHTVFNVGCVVFFGFLAYFLEKNGFSRTPMILGLILGPIAEQNLQRAMQMSRMNFMPYFTRPISLFFFCLTILSVVLCVMKNIRASKREVIKKA